MPFRCVECGYSTGKWMGFCPTCGNEHHLTEEADPRRAVAPTEALPLAKVRASTNVRRTTGIGEIDRVLGGGLVGGSVVLIGGEPGVGKSTLMLQLAASLCESGARTMVCTAEESSQQVAMRAERFGISEDLDLLLVGDDDVDRLIAAADLHRPDLLVVDSIQSVHSREIDGTSGGPAQMRESAARLTRFAKESSVTTVLISHVNKEGNLAGPKLVEHMVDVVLSLEGDTDHGLRALRSLKNRFGPTHVTGVFEMEGEGLVEVPDPSSIFLAGWRGEVPGTVVFPAIEGRRAVLVEIQALTGQSRPVMPRRSVRGVDPNRVHQILAVLERHGRLKVSDSEVYVNVIGGWDLDEPACDLAVALAIASSLVDIPLGPAAAWGEIGLAGEVRSVPGESRRRLEVARMGIERVVAPAPGARLDVRSALLQTGLW
jgi:DNA repair protein RadA/Sms